MLKESIADGLCRVSRFDIIYSSYCRNEQYTSIHDIDLIHVYRRNVKEIQITHFFIVYFKVCAENILNYGGQTVLKSDFGTKDGRPSLSPSFKVRPEI